MPKLCVTCYRDMANDGNNRLVGAPMTPPLGEMVLDIGVESVASGPYPLYTTFIHVRADTDCALAFGVDPVAKAEYHPLEAGERAWYGVLPNHKIAVIGT
jgi:hypothetical protein